MGDFGIGAWCISIEAYRDGKEEQIQISDDRYGWQRSFKSATFVMVVQKPKMFVAVGGEVLEKEKTEQ